MGAMSFTIVHSIIIGIPIYGCLALSESTAVLNLYNYRDCYIWLFSIIREYGSTQSL